MSTLKLKAAFSASQMRNYRLAFGLTGAAAVGGSAWLFRDLADLSQWWLKTDRHDVFETFRNRHKIAVGSTAAAVVNSAIFFKTRCVPMPAYAAINGTYLFMLFSGYINPEIMMRPRNHNALYVPSSDALNLLKREETVIVTKMENGNHKAFPDSQVLRPHVAQIGKTDDDKQVIMTYCGLTNLGMAFEIHQKDVELVPLTQLENNLILMDKSSGHVGQQINGIDETAMLEMIGGKTYQETKRRRTDEEMSKLKGSEFGKEIPTWRMKLGDFVRTYPEGEVFINDYKMFPAGITRPVKTVYDKLMDYIFEFSVYLQATNPNPVFPTLENIDPRLPPKEQVFGFNVGDDYVAITENFVRDSSNGVRNMTVGGEHIVASYDKDHGSLGIWKCPSTKPVKQTVDIHGHINGKGQPLERVSTVKAGAFWCVFATFFPQTSVNPEN